MGWSLSLSGDIRGAPLCSKMTSGVIAALTGEGSESSSEVDDVRDRVLNPKQGPESEDEMDDVEEAQGRSEEGFEMGGCGRLKETLMNVKLND